MKYCSKDLSGDGIRLFTSSKALPDAWDEFLPEGHFLKKSQLFTTEAARLPDLDYIYVLTLQNGQPVSAAYFQVLRLKPAHINSGLVSARQNILWTLFTRTAAPKLLIAGHLFRHDICSFYPAHTLSAFEAYKCYKQSIDAALRYSCAMAVLVKDLATELTTYFNNFAPQYLLLRNDISMELKIPADWKSMADYEHALKHKYAQRLRKIRGAWEGVRVQELTPAEVAENKARIFDLYRQVTAHQQVRLGFLSPDFLVLLKTQHPGQLKVWGIYEGSNLIAFYSAWVKGEVFDMFYIGFDYNRNADLQLYFNILFFSIEQAIYFNCRKLVLGRTALDAKARLGCSPRYLSTFLYIRNNFIRKRILAMQTRNSAQEGAWEERHPFQERSTGFLIIQYIGVHEEEHCYKSGVIYRNTCLLLHYLLPRYAVPAAAGDA